MTTKPAAFRWRAFLLPLKVPMPKVKLNTSRVTTVNDQRRFVSQPAGTIVDCSDKEAQCLVDSLQGCLVKGEKIDQSKIETKTEVDPGSKLEAATDLGLLELKEAHQDLLELAGDDNVPGFASVSQLVTWVQDPENKLSDKKGIGKSTETTILAAIDAWVEAMTPATEADAS